MSVTKASVVVLFATLALGLTGCPDKKTEAPEGATAEPPAPATDNAAAPAEPAPAAAPAEEKKEEAKEEKKDEGGGW